MILKAKMKLLKITDFFSSCKILKNVLKNDHEKYKYTDVMVLSEKICKRIRACVRIYKMNGFRGTVAATLANMKVFRIGFEHEI